MCHCYHYEIKKQKHILRFESFLLFIYEKTLLVIDILITIIIVNIAIMDCVS